MKALPRIRIEMMVVECQKNRKAGKKNNLIWGNTQIYPHCYLSFQLEISCQRSGIYSIAFSDTNTNTTGLKKHKSTTLNVHETPLTCRFNYSRQQNTITSAVNCATISAKLSANAITAKHKAAGEQGRRPHR